MTSNTTGDWSSVVSAFAIGLAVASAPGPVQAIVVAEAIRGGVARGLVATGGACVSFGMILVVLALGVSVATIGNDVVRVLQAVGGIVLLWFAVDGYRSATTSTAFETEAFVTAETRWPAPVRIGIAVLVFPGTWLFVAGVASPLISTARASAGLGLAIAIAFSLTVGTVAGNSAISILAGLGRNIASTRTLVWIRKGLSVVLGLIGVAMLGGALVGTR